MFQERLRPVAIGGETVVAARLSLNAPIVSTPELTAGPARAAIVAIREDGGEQVVVIVRSLAPGRVVQYEMRGDELRATTQLAMDAALSFAESMGFLFDDEAIAGQPGEQREQVFGRLRELLSQSGAGSAEPELELETDDGLDEILLEAEELELDEVLEPAPDLAAPPLSKFRGATKAPRTQAPGDSAMGITLGRVRPIRKPAAEPPSIPPLLRLLTWF